MDPVLENPSEGVQALNEAPQEDKTFRVLEIISHSPRASQRELASSTGLSLGLVNLTLKRLIQTGHIKVSNLNSKKVEYLLTPKGLMEKTRRTYVYVSRTLRTYSEYQKRLERMIKEFRGQAVKGFAVIGQGEIASLVEMALRNFAADLPYRILKDGERPNEGEVALDCRLDGYDGSFGISVLTQLLAAEPPKENRSSSHA